MSYRAKRQPRFDSPAAWAKILSSAQTYPVLEGRHSADIAVIGAGFAGLSAAQRLHQLDPTLRIAVLDALRIAEGSAGRNSGFMIDLPHDLASDDYAGGGDDAKQIRLNRQAICFAQDAVAEYTINPAYAELAGKVNGAASEVGDQHNRAYANHLATLGERSEKLDAQAMFELTGSRHYRAGLYTPGTLMLQPAGYVRGLASGLASKGVRIFERSAVTEFKKQSGHWQIETSRGTLNAGQIVLAVNGHLESFGVAKGRLMQLFLYASMTPELTQEDLQTLGGVSRWGVTPSDPMGTTMRRIDTAQGGNRIVTRTCATVRPDMQASARDVARAARVQRSKFADRYPQLAGLRMQYEWAGHLCLSLNGVAVAREIEDGVISACVQNGLGTARGTLTGIAAAETALGQDGEIAAHFKNEDMPKRLPPQPFATWGANTYLWWK